MKQVRKIGGREIHFLMDEQCNVCGGNIPDPIYWPELGETNNGNCSGHIGEDGFCGGFCAMTHDDDYPEREADWYEEYKKEYGKWRSETTNEDEK